jgi:hypothetical protein
MLSLPLRSFKSHTFNLSFLILKGKYFLFVAFTVTAEGLAHAHNAKIPLQHMRINPDLKTFAPQIMHMRIIAKICILALFLGFFWSAISSKNFRNNIFRLNSTRAIDWCMNYHAWLGKKFESVGLHRTFVKDTGTKK